MDSFETHWEAAKAKHMAEVQAIANGDTRPTTTRRERLTQALDALVKLGLAESLLRFKDGQTAYRFVYPQVYGDAHSVQEFIELMGARSARICADIIER